MARSHLGCKEKRRKIHKYSSYDEYVAAQDEANKRKLSNVWIRAETVEKIKLNTPHGVAAILCHGTRNGAEQKMFAAQFPAAHVLGTDIADTAYTFPNTVKHDFHDAKPEWLGKFDIVYSNALDHAVKPTVALRTWKAQLSPTGRMFIEHSFTDECNKSTASDPLEVSEAELRSMFKRAGLSLIGTFDASGVKGTAACASIVFILERA